MSNVADYERRFLKENSSVARSGCATKVSKPVYSMIRHIVQVANTPGINISAYIDNVLREHIDSHYPEMMAYIDKQRQQIQFYRPEP